MIALAVRAADRRTIMNAQTPLSGDDANALRSVLILPATASPGWLGIAEWLACWTQAQKVPGSYRSRDVVG